MMISPGEYLACVESYQNWGISPGRLDIFSTCQTAGCYSDLVSTDFCLASPQSPRHHLRTESSYGSDYFAGR